MHTSYPDMADKIFIKASTAAGSKLAPDWCFISAMAC
jgi:hypothetical protein